MNTITRNTLLFIFSICTNISFAQNSFEPILNEAEQMPYFPGCDYLKNGTDEKRTCSNQNIVNYISSKLHYPDAAKEAGLEGTVYLSFVIDKNGNVKNPKIIRDIGEDCGEEAVRVLNAMPQWEPARNKNQFVAVKLTIPVNFSLATVEKDLSENYSIIWGIVNEENVSKTALVNNSLYPIAVRDRFGNEIKMSELRFFYKKNKRTRHAKSNGTINKDQIQLLKKMKKNSQLTISAVIQEKGKFITIGRDFFIKSK